MAVLTVSSLETRACDNDEIAVKIQFSLMGILCLWFDSLNF